MQNKVWIISDTHFFHKNVIGYEKRPFTKAILNEANELEAIPDVETMNEVMITNWNNKIGKQDKVFHLGDVSFANKEKTKSVVERLNGHKILILGNHDRSHKQQWWKDTGFQEVYRYPIIYSQWYILSHEPVTSNIGQFRNIHGHIHGNELTNNNDSFYNVCVDKTDFQPTLFTDILKKYKI